MSVLLDGASFATLTPPTETARYISRIVIDGSDAQCAKCHIVRASVRTLGISLFCAVSRWLEASHSEVPDVACPGLEQELYASMLHTEPSKARDAPFPGP